MSNANGRASTGQGFGNTGAPCENGQICASCHSSGSFGSILETMTIIDLTTNQPATSYIADRDYQVTFTFQSQFGNPAGWGFQACSIDATNNGDIGKWQNPASNVKSVLLGGVGTCGSRTYVEHSGGVSSSNSFTIGWKAPSLDVGLIKFYFTGNAVNGTGNTGGDNGGTGNSFDLPFACTPTLAVNANPINSETYQAGQTLTSTGTIPSGNNVEFLAGDCIELQADFTVDLGAEFTADIEACN